MAPSSVTCTQAAAVSCFCKPHFRSYTPDTLPAAAMVAACACSIAAYKALSNGSDDATVLTSMEMHRGLKQDMSRRREKGQATRL